MANLLQALLVLEYPTGDEPESSGGEDDGPFRYSMPRGALPLSKQ